MAIFVRDSKGTKRCVHAHSVGITPEEAIDVFCHFKLNSKLEKLGESLPLDSHGFFDWGYVFTSDDGTSFKAAGFYGPNKAYSILTWWE